MIIDYFTFVCPTFSLLFTFFILTETIGGKVALPNLFFEIFQKKVENRKNIQNSGGWRDPGLPLGLFLETSL